MGLIRQYRSTMHGSYWTAIIKYGALCGVFLSFVVLFRFWIYLPLSTPNDYVQDFSLLVCLFVAVWVYKRSLEDKKITLKEAYIVALGCGIVAAVVYGMFLLLYSRYIDVDMPQRYFDIQRAVEQNAQHPDSTLREFTSSRYLAAMGMIFISILSVIEALVVAVIMKNEKATVVTKEMKKQDKLAKKEAKQEKQQ